MASARYRTLIPAAELKRADWDSRVIPLGVQTQPRIAGERLAGIDVAVIGKFYANEDQMPAAGERVLELLRALTARGVRIVADFCDDNFGLPVVGPTHVSILHAADLAVASTPGMAEVLREQGHTNVCVIGDPVEGERSEVRVRDCGAQPLSAEKPLRLLWYGHKLNLPTIPYGLEQLEKGLRVPVALTLVSSGDAAQKMARELDVQLEQRGGGCRFAPWSVNTVFQELRMCDAVLIPSNPLDPRKAVKSPNRFNEALWAGRFVVAHPLPSYAELAPFGWVGEDLAEGFAWYGAHPEDAAARIRAGQAAVEARYSREAIAEEWKKALTG